MSMDSADAVVPTQQAMGHPTPTNAPACAVVVRAGGNPEPSQAPGYSTPRRGETPAAADRSQVPGVGPDDSISQVSVGSARRQEQQRLAIMAAAYQTQVATARLSQEQQEVMALRQRLANMEQQGHGGETLRGSYSSGQLNRDK
jgi:hypothetical protein